MIVRAQRSGEGRPPKGCTCLLTVSPDANDGRGFWAIYIAKEDCPVHRPKEETHG